MGEGDEEGKDAGFLRKTSGSKEQGSKMQNRGGVHCEMFIVTFPPIPDACEIH
jgi:hypothetical protein